MPLLVGLGNPGENYANTRHNIGFLVLDELASRAGISFSNKKKLEAEIATLPNAGSPITLLKPQTFMNVSGRSVGKALRQTNVPAEQIVVVYDDADLPFGDIRFRASGSSGGHNGMQSILELFPRNTAIKRLRIGIGRPRHVDIPLESHVLGRWTSSETEALPTLIDDAITTLVNEQILHAS